MKIIYLLVAVLLSCSKQETEQQRSYIQFSLGSTQKKYTDVRFQSTDFCGQQLYSITGAKGSSELFLISIITDTLRVKKYILDAVGGCNIWSSQHNDYTKYMEINITEYGKRIIATFNGSMYSGIKISNGIIVIEN